MMRNFNGSAEFNFNKISNTIRMGKLFLVEVQTIFFVTSVMENEIGSRIICENNLVGRGGWDVTSVPFFVHSCYRISYNINCNDINFI